MLKSQDDFNIKITLRSAIDAIKWFKNEISGLLSKNEKQTTESELNDKYDSVQKFEVGKMYLFHYDPKNKESLPYYDTFPLILMMGFTKGGFYGINVHYLPLKVRTILLSNLMDKAVFNDGDLDRLRISYNIVKNVTTLQMFRPCFKMYLSKQIRGAIKLIPPEDWGYAIVLPLENFKKENKYTIWKESMDSLN